MWVDSWSFKKFALGIYRDINEKLMKIVQKR